MLEFKDFKDRMRDVMDYISPWDKEAHQDLRFAALQQWNEEDIDKLRAEQRPALVFDKTRVIIDAVSGSEIINRFEPKFYPRNLPGEDIDLEASEVLQDAYKWARQQADTEHQESLMFRDMLITGVGAVDVFMDYTENPDGRIVTKRIPIYQVAWDPTSVDANMADADFVVRDKWIPETTFDLKYPDFAGVYRGGLDREGNFLLRAWQQVTERNKSSYSSARGYAYYDPKHKHVHVWEYQWRELRPYVEILVPDPMGTFQRLVVPKAEADEVLQQAYEANEAVRMQLQAVGLPFDGEVSFKPFDKHIYRRAMIAGQDILEEMEEPLNDFTIKFVTGFEDWSNAERKYYFGLMKPMRDPQKYVNTFLSQAVHIWSTSPKGAFLHEPGFFEDEEDAAQRWATPNPFIQTQQGALSTTQRERYRIIENARSFAGTEPLFHFSQQAVTDASGVNPAYTAGTATDVRRAATSAIQLVQQQNLSTLGMLFDSLRRYRKDHAKLVLGFLREYVSPEQTLRILGPTKAQLVPLTKDDLVREYDIVVDEAPTSPNRQMEVFEKFVQTGLIEGLIQMGIWPPDGWKYLGLPSDLGNQIMQRHSMMEQMMLQQQQAAAAAPPVEEAAPA